ncbi:MAG: DUF6298 domain-containing protein, partial [Nitrosomonadales bacterium]|nr:DUF6298 domain-containing protein [Nitrosomonadales bacterium]
MKKRLFIFLLFLSANCFAEIRPWPENPGYWSFEGKPVVLAGASDDDNLFQWPAKELTDQLERLQAVGGNLVRNTMSDRRDKGFEIYPYREIAAGKYDLDQWNPEYWQRFEYFLAETAKRKIIVQIELWDRFDFSDHGEIKHWSAHPYNPENNINYSHWRSGFKPRYLDHPGENKQPFFFTTPKQRNNKLILAYQQKFINKVLEHSLKYDHVLYCIDNETKADSEWSEFWAKYVKQLAQQKEKVIYVTEMLDDRTMDVRNHSRTLDHPALYDFVEISQNNHNSGNEHWQNLLRIRAHINHHPRPMNSIKVYGANGNTYGNDQDALQRFWLNVIGGTSAIRFHRPVSGLGLNEKSGNAIRALRILQTKVNLWEFKPLMRSPAKAGSYMAGNGTSFLIYLEKNPGQDISKLIGESRVEGVLN